MGLSKLKNILIPAVLVGIGLLAWSNSFSVPFLHDDVPSISENAHIRSLWPIWEAARAPWPSALSGRPVTTFTFALNYAISGEQVWSYHLFNLLFHVLSALLLLGIIRRTLLSPALKDRLGPASTPLALASAAIWLAHPLHTNSVTFLVQRAESLMGMFYLLTLYCAVRAFRAEKARRWYAMAVGACLMGMASKEAMITAPLVVLLYDRIFVSDSFKQLLKARWWFYALLAATGAVVIAYVLMGSRAKAETVATMTTWQFFITQLEAIVRYYLKLSIWPHPLVFDYGAPFAESLVTVIPYALVLLALAAATIWALWRHPPAGFLGAWFFIILSPSSSVIKRAGESISERVMYLPLAAIAAVAVVYLYLLFKRMTWPPRLLAATGLVIVIALGLTTHYRNRDYRSALILWTDTVEKRPDNARAWLNLGSEYTASGNHEKALEAYEGCISANPGYPNAYNRRGMSYGQLGRHHEALKDFKKAIQLDPTFAEAYINRATAYGHHRKFTQALADLAKAIELDPAQPHAYRIRGSIHGMQGDLDLAIADFTRAIALNPEDPDPYIERATAFTMKNNIKRATHDLQKALELDPKNPRALMRLQSLQKSPQ